VREHRLAGERHRPDLLRRPADVRAAVQVPVRLRHEDRDLLGAESGGRQLDGLAAQLVERRAGERAPAELGDDCLLLDLAAELPVELVLAGRPGRGGRVPDDLHVAPGLARFARIVVGPRTVGEVQVASATKGVCSGRRRW
jgi:hypothetical protein